MSILIHTFVAGPLETNAYVVACSHTRQAWIIDAPPDVVGPLISLVQAEEFNLQALILTHSHWDHIASAHELVQRLAVPIWVHAADRGNVEAPGSDGVPGWLAIQASKVDRLLVDGEQLQLGDSVWRVLHTPGHTPGGCCLFCELQKLLISGDTLFDGAFGRVDLTTGDPQAMLASLNKLAALPGDIRFLPGHGPSSTLAMQSWLHDAERLRKRLLL